MTCPNINNWCFVCASWISRKDRHTTNSKSITSYAVQALQAYYNDALVGLGTGFAPSVLCSSCYLNLTRWMAVGDRGLSMTVPAKWRQPTKHQGDSTVTSDCFFCVSKPKKGKVLATPMFFPASSVEAPVTRNKGERWPESPLVATPEEAPMDISEEDESDSETEEDDPNDPDWEPENGPVPISGLINQEILSTIIMTLGVPQNKSELLGSILLRLGLLEPGTKINQRNRSTKFNCFFQVKQISFEVKAREGVAGPSRVEKSIVICSDIRGLFDCLGGTYVAEDWRLFLDGSAKTFKGILLHNEPDPTKRLPSIHIAFGNDIPESYETVQKTLELLEYDNHQWQVQGDFKMLNILSGMKSGASKYPCVLCNWDSRAYDLHYLPGKTRLWTAEDRLPGNWSFVKPALVPPHKLVLPELHCRMGLFQIFIKQLFIIHRETPHPAFIYYCKKFPRISDAKLQVGSLNGPDILKLVEDSAFVNELEKVSPCAELDAWLSYVEVVHSFFGKDSRPTDYKERIGDLLSNYQQMGCNMSLKLHFLDEHIDRFPVFLSSMSEQHGERGHQEMKGPSRLYPSTESVRVMSERCFQIQTRPVQLQHRKEGASTSHF